MEKTRRTKCCRHWETSHGLRWFDGFAGTWTDSITPAPIYYDDISAMSMASFLSVSRSIVETIETTCTVQTTRRSDASHNFPATQAIQSFHHPSSWCKVTKSASSLVGKFIARHHRERRWYQDHGHTNFLGRCGLGNSDSINSGFVENNQDWGKMVD